MKQLRFIRITVLEFGFFSVAPAVELYAPVRTVFLLPPCAVIRQELYLAQPAFFYRQPGPLLCQLKQRFIKRGADRIIALEPEPGLGIVVVEQYVGNPQGG